MDIEFDDEAGGKLTMSIEEYLTIYNALRSTAVFNQAFAIGSTETMKMLDILEEMRIAVPWIHDSFEEVKK